MYDASKIVCSITEKGAREKLVVLRVKRESLRVERVKWEDSVEQSDWNDAFFKKCDDYMEQDEKLRITINRIWLIIHEFEKQRYTLTNGYFKPGYCWNFSCPVCVNRDMNPGMKIESITTNFRWNSELQVYEKKTLVKLDKNDECDWLLVPSGTRDDSGENKIVWVACTKREIVTSNPNHYVLKEGV